MNTKENLFNRVALTILVLLYLISLGSFTYLNWTVEGEPHLIWNHVVNALILSIPLILLYGGIYILVAAWRERKLTGQVRPRWMKVIHLAPRIAAIAIIFFVTLFSLDVFGGEETIWQQLGGFVIHSLPSIGMIILLVIAWKRPLVGFVAFLLAGIFFLRFVFFGSFDPGNFLIFSAPLLLISALFYLDWRWNQEVPPTTPILPQEN